MKRRLRKPLPRTSYRQFTVYLPKELEQWLRDQAFVAGRTLTKQTEFILRAGREALAQPEERS